MEKANFKNKTTFIKDRNIHEAYRYSQTIFSGKKILLFKDKNNHFNETR